MSTYVVPCKNIAETVLRYRYMCLLAKHVRLNVGASYRPAWF